MAIRSAEHALARGERGEGWIYLDAAATTPPLPEVCQAILDVQQQAWGNPASLHPIGLRAAETLERSRMRVAAALGASSDEVVFCSGGTEAAHLAIRGTAASMPPGRIVISAVEHPSVVAAAGTLEARGWQVDRWPVDAAGYVRLEALEWLLAPPTCIVSLIWGQSEVGTVQPIETIGEACRDRDIVVHTDAVQCAGHLRIDWKRLPIDLLTLSGHKLQGPKGIGVMLRRMDRPMQPLFGGGGQEDGLRSGTVPVALARGLAVALEHAAARLRGHQWSDPTLSLRDRLERQVLQLPGVRLVGSREQRLPHHLCLELRDRHARPLAGRAVVRALGRRGVAVSSGSACSSGHATASPILRAMGRAGEEAACGLRLTLGPWLTADALDTVPPLLAEAMDEVAEARAAGASHPRAAPGRSVTPAGQPIGP